MISKLPSYKKLCYGSSVYDIQSNLSDIDFIILQIDTSIPVKLKDPDTQVVTIKQFKNNLVEHDLKTLEIYYENFDFFYNKLEMEHTLNLDKLRRVVSATVSNSYVKAKKKITLSQDEKSLDIYVGLKSYWHCIRILVMFSHLAKYKHFKPSSFKKQLMPIYVGIMSYMFCSKPSKFEEVDKEFKTTLRQLQTDFRILAPLITAN